MDRLSKAEAARSLRACVAVAAFLACSHDAVAQTVKNGDFKLLDSAAVYNVPLGNTPQRGARDALVTLVMFGDFECEHSRRSLDIVAMLQALYGSDLRVAFKPLPLPFRPHAELAAQAALAARSQGKFWEYHDLLFAHQDALERSDLERYARVASLDLASFGAELDDGRHRAELEHNVAFVRSLTLVGTPTFFINGRTLLGVQPTYAFIRAIDEELAKAKAVIAQGAPREGLYERVIAHGSTARVLLGGAARKAAKRILGVDGPSRTGPNHFPSEAPARGVKLDPKVVIQIFGDLGDYECQEAQPTLRRLLAEHGDELTLVWRNNPSWGQARSLPAAEAAMEVFEQAGADAFWQYHDILLANRRSSPLDLVQHARKLKGVDPAKIQAALETRKQRPRVVADIIDLAAIGVVGSLAFSVNGRLLEGPTSYEVFKSEIDRALNEPFLPQATLAPLPRAAAAEVADYESRIATVDTLPLYELACARGVPRACFLAAGGYVMTGGVRDQSKRLALLKATCDQGLVDGCVTLGVAYELGKGATKNRSKAMALYAKGCEGGKATGCYLLGALHEDKATPASIAKAMDLYRKACSMGDPDGCDAAAPPASPSSRVLFDPKEHAIGLNRPTLFEQRSLRLDPP